MVDSLNHRRNDPIVFIVVSMPSEEQGARSLSDEGNLASLRVPLLPDLVYCIWLLELFRSLYYSPN